MKILILITYLKKKLLTNERETKHARVHSILIDHTGYFKFELLLNSWKASKIIASDRITQADQGSMLLPDRVLQRKQNFK